MCQRVLHSLQYSYLLKICAIFFYHSSLTLPGDDQDVVDELNACDIKWLSVWCRDFKISFGDLYFPEDLDCTEMD